MTSLFQFAIATGHPYPFLVALFIVANLTAFFLAMFFIKKYPIVGSQVLRMVLAVVLIQYGYLKFTKSQGFGIKLRGDISAVSSAELFWYFFGYSYGYLIYLGCLEVLAGVLLFFKRTSSLGALLALALLGNIAVMDFVYRVGPVKYLATNLTALVCLLIYVDRQRYIDAFRAITARD